MAFHEKIKKIQKHLVEQGVDGWLLYDNHGSNRFVRQVLALSPHQVLTRRFFYWIPREGEPQKIVHRIEAESLDLMPGQKHLYLSWLELAQTLKKVLKNTKKILMEYSLRGAIPSISVVDAGTFEMIRQLVVEVLSSADLLQCVTSVLDDNQMRSHLEAAHVLQTTIARTWDLIADRIKKERRITEYEVQKFILNELIAHNCLTEEGPC